MQLAPRLHGRVSDVLRVLRFVRDILDVIEEDVEEGDDPECRRSVSGHYHGQVLEDGEELHDIFEGVLFLLQYDILLKIVV